MQVSLRSIRELELVKSARIGMPLLSSGQAQKDVTHNEALTLLDFVVHGSVAGGPLDVPPQDPETGCSYLCGLAPEGAWRGYPRYLANWTAGGWRFVAPFDGLQFVDRTAGGNWRFRGGEWTYGIVDAAEVRVNGNRVVGPQQAPIPNPNGGAVIDTEARNALVSVLSALRSHGLLAP